ncbi:hypothetical protein TGGT1_408850 [Toxoplasma gondii GT1]|uniref:Uncharacterized protein n=1 Tax=Toxoplasma gondii (strain ATCC 50853 / GT1) TaxID=507601 RepID=S7UZF9_TOXGG|nr:hypothetical protein TGGT1_408850 [Toxoplasma gondii GT1]
MRLDIPCCRCTRSYTLTKYSSTSKPWQACVSGKRKRIIFCLSQTFQERWPVDTANILFRHISFVRQAARPYKILPVDPFRLFFVRSPSRRIHAPAFLCDKETLVSAAFVFGKEKSCCTDRTRLCPSADLLSPPTKSPQAHTGSER